LPIALFAMMARGTPLTALSGALVLACVAGGVSAVGAVATAEQFPGEGRLTGLALGPRSRRPCSAASRRSWRRSSSTRPVGDGSRRLDRDRALGVLPVLLRLPETAPCRIAHR
jgi:MHS family proline/betaine transporter-like MFS transporter